MQNRFLFLILAALLLASLACKAAQGEQISILEPTLPSPATSAAATIAASTPAVASQPATPTPIRVTNTPSVSQAGSSIPGTGASPTATPTSQITAASPFNPTMPPAIEVLPTFTVIPSPTLPPTEAATPSADERNLQEQVFEQLWTIIHEQYLYADFNGQDWQTVRQDYAQRIQTGLSMRDFYLAMYQMVRGLGDEHSTFFDPEQAKAQDAEYAGTYDYVGIGVLTGVVEEKNNLTVLLVFPNSPAERAGIRMHDSLLSADGQPLVDENGTRATLLRGPEGTPITVEVQTPGQPPRTLTITRQRVNSTLPVPYQVMTSPNGKRVGYIFIPTFNDSTVGASIRTALEAMAAQGSLDGVILDNRENGGGASPVLEETLSYFMDGVAGYFVEQDASTALQIRGQDIKGSQQVPLVVMVGQGTASFGEIFAGALHDLDRAYLIGEQTQGNVEILSIFNLPDGSRAWIATMNFKPVNDPNANWEETGIIPDETVPSSWDEVTTETDPAVQAALRHFDNP